MNRDVHRASARVLAVHFATHGFGWVFFPNPNNPTEWGVTSIRKNRNEQSLHRLEYLIAHLRPTEIILEQFEGNAVRRQPRVQELYRSVIKLARSFDLEPRIFERSDIRHVFAQSSAKTRYEIATVVSKRIEQFAHLLPEKRKIWVPENPRMSLFNAAALALAYFAYFDDAKLLV